MQSTSSSWLATQYPDPQREMWQKESESGGKYFGGEIYSQGINTTRGRTAETIRDLILRDATYIKRFRAAWTEW